MSQSMSLHLTNKKDESSLKAELSHVAKVYVTSFKPSSKDIGTHKMLINPCRCNGIAMFEQDEVYGVVIVKRTDYMKGLTYIINDKQKF